MIPHTFIHIFYSSLYHAVIIRGYRARARSISRVTNFPIFSQLALLTVHVACRRVDATQTLTDNWCLVQRNYIQRKCIIIIILYYWLSIVNFLLVLFFN